MSTLRRSNPNTPSQGYALRPTNPNALSQVSTEELLLELRRRIIAPRTRRPDTWDDWDGGLDPHGDWPDRASSARSSLTKDFSVFAQTTQFGTTARNVDGKAEMTPSWKTAMLLLMVLYPMVMLQSKFVAPVIGKLGAQPWLSVWLSQVVSVALMQWWLMPTVSSWCRRWLDPVDGAGLRISLRGAAVAVIVYAASLTVFATVEWLQYWN